ncbi:arginine:ornithine antiporter, APA family (TC 2.A.3.2.3) [Anaerosphaera aminiphila DSM 21120]|uniref:Arginine:ornithine antiporter, APA family (TC 2.A.3.2.3) n=1 Tax=Anaerosphaera aminiphila DSM 21120 TaxID=1120995 RepID=A0A1M5PQZ1_9FIRM|nr:basic amino acid/polyamine antiporter [Anaerosphaera aminiphila]SHH04142.1 arginine:ornithine antiporter, APA family (TC 2.A.3.2.3) [Anaerosphaera aminiphila DSM 21120]
MEKDDKKLNVVSLVGIIVSAIIGAGIFNLPKEMASSASAGVTILSWLIAGLGMGSLAFCMQNLSNKKPDLHAGIFSFAQEGFGDFMGFNSVWGYWVSVIIGNVAFGTLMFSAIGYFFPAFGNGENILSIIGASLILWLIHYIICKGLDNATFLNNLVMVAKLIPIIIFIVCVIGGFNKGIFFHRFWSMNTDNFYLPDVVHQLKNTMLVTVWVFIGIEGAVVFSGRAKKRSDVGKATLLGFAAVTVIYMSITVFSYGIMTQAEIQSLPNPAMAYILERVIGKPGAIIVNLGVIISIFGAWIANTLLAEEVSYQAGERKLFPVIFTKENKNQVPVNALLITNIIVQILLLSFLITDEAYSLLSQLSSATILLPYTCVALYQLKLTHTEKSSDSTKNYIIGIIATVYMFWLIYASGFIYTILTILTLLPGAIMFIYVKKYYKQKVFKPYEIFIFIVIAVLFVYGMTQLPVLMKM